ncbi:hypothetical protein [Bradyrhizobium sp. USDA 3315]
MRAPIVVAAFVALTLNQSPAAAAKKNYAAARAACLAQAGTMEAIFSARKGLTPKAAFTRNA